MACQSAISGTFKNISQAKVRASGLSFILCGAVWPVLRRILRSTQVILIPTLENGHWHEYPENLKLTFWCSLLLSHLLPFLPRQFPPPILSIWFWREPKPPQTSSPWWSHLLVQQHDFGDSSHPTPWEPLWKGSSKVAVEGFYSNLLAGREKINLQTRRFYLFFITLPTLSPSKQWIYTPPPPLPDGLASSPSSSPLSAPVFGWLVCVLSSIGGHLRPPNNLFIYIFVVSIVAPNDWTTPSSHSL